MAPDLMLVIPAIDLKDGCCVRLVEGREESARVYDRDPLDVAHAYREAGASLIHVVDLDGAFLGAASANQKIIRRIIAEVGVPVEVGGGVRSLADIDELLEAAGAAYAIVGTLAVERPEILQAALERFNERVVVGIDARGLRVATRGWTEETAVDAIELARRVVSMGARRIVYTDIARDGRLEGPNFELTRRVALESGARVTASGGIASLDDVARLAELEPDGVDAAIVGKALYENRFTVEQALAAARRPGEAPKTDL